MGGHVSGFIRLRGPVVFMRAVSEDNSLFNFNFDDEHDGTAYGARIMRRGRCLRCLSRLFTQFMVCNGLTAATSCASLTAMPITSRC